MASARLRNRKSASTPEDAGGFYPIRTVSEITGVNSITLRAWERRYGLIKPSRTASGHRVYSEQDISKINRIVSLLSKGISIGQVARQLEYSQNQEQAHNTVEQEWLHYREQMLKAIAEFDEAALDQVYTEALALYPIETVTQNILTPLLQTIGERWEHKQLTVAEEHFFSVYLRNKLGARFHHRRRNTRGPLLLLACLPSEDHELGLLFLALAAHQSGYRVILLGANLPLEEIPSAARQTGCDAVVLSSTTRPASKLLEETLEQVVSEIKVPVFVGGKSVDKYAEAINKTGAVVVGSDINEGLSMIAQRI